MPEITAGMRARHWERLSSALGTRVFPGADGELNLQKLILLGITSHMELLQASLGTQQVTARTRQGSLLATRVPDPQS